MLNVYTDSGWRFYGVINEADLRKRLKEHGLTNADITKVEQVNTPPAKYNLDTVYFAGVRDEVKQGLPRARGRSTIRKRGS
ncbi:hypothetical protein [Thermococcus sp.]